MVAEGLETEQTLEKVDRLGFSHGQGYCLGRPSTLAG
jgi:EAL domain-containing protein (putative c-di-GMP-specific phosphodiesterase class I)